MATNELPTRGNKRGGPGWWMDEDGVWRSPNEWPEDTPPLDGWVRNRDGQWNDPGIEIVDDDISIELTSATRRAAGLEPIAEEPKPKESRQANADRKAILTVVGIIVGALALLVGALVLITQAGAEDIPEDVAATPDVIFAAETELVRRERRAAVAADAPTVARGQLAQLEVRADDDVASEFDSSDWEAERTDCVDITERVLVARSQRPIIWADQLECVPDQGQWVDRYLDITITRTLDAEVIPHVPPAVAFVSGGSEWTPATVQEYLTDLDHPATLGVVSAGSGHNPRAQDPAQWTPSMRSSWCAYAIDWIAVKNRWELSATADEVAALAEMLDTCVEPDSNGPDLLTMVIDPIAEPTIERIDGAAE